MKTPDQESIDSWIATALRISDKRKKYLHNGWYQQEDLPLQTHFKGLANDYAGLGRARFFNGESLDVVRETFTEAGKYMLQNFTMAYCINDFRYIGDKPKRDDQINAGHGQVDWSDVNETAAIGGFNWSLMGANFTVARDLAYWYQDRPDGRKMEPCVNRYVFAYKYILLGEAEKAEALLRETIDEYQVKPPRTTGDMNYYTLSLAMQGIAIKDEDMFNKGLDLHLDFYKKVAIPSEDYWDTALESICDDVVALANLALDAGLNVTIENDLLPTDFLIK